MKKKNVEPQAPETELSIPIRKSEFLALRDSARGVELLAEIGRAAGDVNLSQVLWILDKVTGPLWDLAFDELQDRWNAEHPDSRMDG